MIFHFFCSQWFAKRIRIHDSERDRDTSESCLEPTMVDSITVPLYRKGGRQEMPALSVTD